jgi:triacylglycerol lipase
MPKMNVFDGKEFDQAAHFVEQVYLAADGKPTEYQDGFIVHDIYGEHQGIFVDKQLFAQIVINGSNLGIAFRGTMDAHDWITNADTRLVEHPGLEGECHEGFLSLYESMSEQIKEVIASSIDQLTTVVITGHSLGGALATLCALDLAINHINDGSVFLITFASPRVFEIDGANAFMKLVPHTARVFNSEDIVPNMPVPAHGYSHVGDCAGFTMARGDIIKNHAMETHRAATHTWAGTDIQVLK